MFFKKKKKSAICIYLSEKKQDVAICYMYIGVCMKWTLKYTFIQKEILEEYTKIFSTYLLGGFGVWRHEKEIH